MGEDTIPSSQPVISESVKPTRPECCICFEQYVLDFVPNRCKHKGQCMDCLYILMSDASTSDPDPLELNEDYKRAARCSLAEKNSFG